MSSPLNWSIFRHSLFLAMGVALALALASVTIIVFSPIPFDFPISCYDVAQMFRVHRVDREGVRTAFAITNKPPPATDDTEEVAIIRRTIINQLKVKADDFRFVLVPSTDLIDDDPLDVVKAHFRQQTIASAALYGDAPQFNPLIFGAFHAALRQPDGTWLVISRIPSDPGTHLREPLKWLALALLLILPVAWSFSSRLARPIREFAAAADRIGRGGFEHIDVSGPSEIRLAAAALNEMQARLQRHINERTSIVAAIAHDLRAPLSRLGFMLSGATPALGQKVETEIAEMDRMISVTLDFVQNETAQVRREAVDLRLLIEGIVDDHADRGHAAVMTDGQPVTVLGDAMMLRRLFSNLIANALAYGDAAKVSLRTERNIVTVEIVDRGPGIAAADLPRVFEPFFRAERSRNRATGGTGLGLAIVRSVVVAHNGSVRLVNRPEGGMSALVELPITSDTRLHYKTSTAE